MNIRRFFPFSEWLPEYSQQYARKDLLAGLTVAVMLIPQGMAYGLLAGLPPVYGLYSGLVPLFLYAFLGTSRQLSVGPTALVSLLVLSGISAFAEPGSEEFVQMAILTAGMAGLIQLILGFMRLGFLINFLSEPVISGFTAAAAIIIAMSQLKNLLGVPLSRSNRVGMLIRDLIEQWGTFHGPTVIVGLAGIVVLVLLRRWKRSFPGALLLVVLGIVSVRAGDLDERGLAIVGAIPPGLPSLRLPTLDWATGRQLLPTALTICLISFIESLAIARFIQRKHKNYRIRPDQELLALGFSKVGGAFFQAFPTTGSFTRSAVNDQAGARTGMASVFAATFLGITLLFLTPWFYDLPKALLASIIIVSVTGLIDIRQARYLWRADRRDFFTFLATFLLTLFLGIQLGVLVGVIISLSFMLYQNARPHMAVLGRLPDTRHYRNVDRFTEAEMESDILVFRFDAQLYFGNADYFRQTVQQFVEEKGEELHLFVLDASNMHDIDSSGVNALLDVLKFLDQRGISCSIAGAIGPLRDRIHRYGILERIGEDHFFLSIADAIDAFRNEAGRQGWRSREALRTDWQRRSRRN